MAIIKRLGTAVTLVAVSLILLSGCDTSMMSVSLELVGAPDRIIYIANVDTEIDLSGFMLIGVLVDGSITEGDLGEWENPNQEPGRIVFHEIDFTKAGVYEVEIRTEWRYMYGIRGRDMVLSYKYFVQVIDDNWLNSNVSDDSLNERWDTAHKQPYEEFSCWISYRQFH